jgi:glyoxylase-like metal-dependent hydrolase (beta-lactamase superfamily II)
MIPTFRLSWMAVPTAVALLNYRQHGCISLKGWINRATRKQFAEKQRRSNSSDSLMSIVGEVAGRPATVETVFKADLSAIRALSMIVPGPCPVAVNGVRVAASIRPRKFVIAGGDDALVKMPRTAFQVVYPDCTVMLDAGLDQATHDSFSPDKPEPYYPDEFATLERALASARMIVLTHHHADHVGGVITSANFAALAAKTVITTEVANCLVNTPHRLHLRLSREAIAKFIVLDYPNYYPVAPGMVLIRSPGHSPDSQMVYIRLQSGGEILHSVDSAWIMDNIHELKGKAAPWVKEDVAAVMAQLRWLQEIAQTESNVTILVTHDDELFERLTRGGGIGAQLAA